MVSFWLNIGFLQGATQTSCHKCCQLVLTIMIMANTWTKIQLNVCPTPLHKFNQNMMTFQSCDVMLHTMSSAVPEKMDSQPGKNSIWHFHSFRTWGAFTLQSQLNFAPPCDFYQGLGPLKSQTSFQSSMLYLLPCTSMLFRCGWGG